MAQHPHAGQGLIISEALRSHTDTPHSVGFRWTSDWLSATQTYTDNTQH